MSNEAADLIVSGRVFRPSVHTTFEQDLFIMDHVRASGIEDIPSQANATQMEKIAEEIVLKAYRTGKLFLIVAGIMTEVGKEWNKEAAEANARFFASVSSPEDKVALRSTLVAVILGFFIDEEGSSRISLKSSDDPEEVTSGGPSENTEASETSESSTPSLEL